MLGSCARLAHHAGLLALLVAGLRAPTLHAQSAERPVPPVVAYRQPTDAGPLFVLLSEEGLAAGCEPARYAEGDCLAALWFGRDSTWHWTRLTSAPTDTVESATGRYAVDPEGHIQLRTLEGAPWAEGAIGSFGGRLGVAIANVDDPIMTMVIPPHPDHPLLALWMGTRPAALLASCRDTGRPANQRPASRTHPALRCAL